MDIHSPLHTGPRRKGVSLVSWYTHARHAREEQGEAVRDQVGPAQALTSRDVRDDPRDILDLRLQLPR